MTIELRDAGAKGYALSGFATTWSLADSHQTYWVSDPKRGTFLERMERGAFVNAVAGREPVSLLREHDPEGPVYAATDKRTMKLVDERDGLVLGAALPKKNPDVEEAVRDIRGGILKGFSVAFVPVSDHWGKAADGRTELRTITAASLFEVSMVSRPANKGAVVTDLRHETRSVGLEYRSVPLVFRADNGGGTSTDLGLDDGDECPTCDGTGMVGTTGASRRTCPDCSGSGVAPDDSDEGSGDRSVRLAGNERSARERRLCPAVLADDDSLDLRARLLLRRRP